MKKLLFMALLCAGTLTQSVEQEPSESEQVEFLAQNNDSQEKQETLNIEKIQSEIAANYWKAAAYKALAASIIVSTGVYAGSAYCICRSVCRKRFF